MIDVSGNGIHLQNISENQTYFDYHKDGFKTHTGWIASGTGFLTRQEADNSLHLFTGTPSGGDGFAELAGMDTNGDGRITSLDAGFSSLRLWMDLNGDGKVDAGEVLSLADAGISSIGLAHSAVSQDIEGNTITGIGSVTMADGTEHGIYDVNFQVDTMDTQAENLPILTSDIQAMPQLHGYGKLVDLRSAMMTNAALKTAVDAFITLPTSTSMDDLRAAVRGIMFLWAGVDGIDPTSRGGVIDARRLAFLEKYIGQGMHFAGYYGTDSNPGMLPSLITNQGWESLETSLLGNLLVQTDIQLSQYFDYDAERGLVEPKVDLEQSLTGLQGIIGNLTSANLDDWMRVATVLASLQQSIILSNGVFADMITLYGAGMKDLGLLVTAVEQGLSASFDNAGVLHISNSPQDGILDTGYGRSSGLSLVYEAGDGAVQMDFSHHSWLSVVKGWMPNTLYLGMDSKDAVSTLLSDGTMVITDGITGDSLTLTGETASSITYQQGVQEFTFSDGVHWHGARITALSWQTTMTNGYAGITYDPSGYVSDITTTGDGNALAYARGYGAVAFHTNGVGEYITFDRSISAADIVMTIDRSTNLVSIGDGITGDVITLDGNWYYDYAGSHSRVSTLQFSDGTTKTLGDGMPFTWKGTSATTSLAGTDFGRNRFVLGVGGNTITSGAAGNTFVMATGIGPATATTGAGLDVVEMTGDISAEDVLLQADAAGDLIIRLDGHPDDTLTVQGDLRRASDGLHSAVGSIAFQDGSSIILGSSTYFTWKPEQGSSVAGSGWAANTFLMSPNVHYIGGAGQQGGSIENTYVMNAAGVGQSTIDSHGSWSTLVLPSDISRDDVVFRADNDTASLIVAFKDRTDTITVQGGLFNAWGGIGSSLKSIHFADGSDMDVGLHGYGLGAPIMFTQSATVPGQHLVGSLYGPNTFVLAPGDDTVKSGNKSRDGSYDNTFLYHRGDGHVLVDMDAALGYVQFGAGITAQDVLVQDGGDHHLVLKLRDSPTDVLDISNSLYQVPWGVIGQVRNMTFADGTMVELGQSNWGLGRPLSFTWTADAAHTVLTGSGYGGNTFELAPGGDTVTAGNGSLGGPNTNTFIFHAGDGHVTVEMNGAVGILVLGAGITEHDLLVQAHDDGTLVVAFRGSQDSISFHGSLYGRAGGEVGSRLGQILFSDGTLIGVAADDEHPHNSLVSTWTEDANGQAMTGSNYGENVFETGVGNDSIATGNGTLGGSGRNTVVWSGTADVTVGANGNKGSVIASNAGLASATFERFYAVQGSSAPVKEGVYVPSGTRGDISITSVGHTLVMQGDITRTPSGSTSVFDLLTFSGGDTSTLNNLPHYTWQANAGRPDVTGRNDGDNTFIAGSGVHSFTGGTHDNQYVMGHGDGAVTAHGNGTYNAVEFKSDVTMADVSMSVNSGQLTASLASTGDSITMTIPIEIGAGGPPHRFSLAFSDGTLWTDVQARQLADGDTVGTINADVLEGRNTQLTGMGGPDSYIFRPGDGMVSISNGSASDTAAKGQLDLGMSMTAQTMWLSRDGQDLLLAHIGDGQSVKVDDWFSGHDSARLAYVRGYDGDYLDTRMAGSLDTLVNAMSAYSQSHAGYSPQMASAMPQDTLLQSSITSTWHHPS